MFGKMFEWVNLTRVLGILGLTNGGTGAATAAGARTNLDVYSKTETEILVSGLLDLRGSFDASGGGYPTTGGSGTAGAILKGDTWKISVAGAIGKINDVVFALIDSPAQTAGNWEVIKGNYESSFAIKSTNYNLTADDDFVEVNASSTTQTLPTAAGSLAKVYNIINSSDGIVTVNTTSSQTINGSLTQIIPAGSTLTVVSNGSNWKII